ncbi:RNA-binding domain-containing protein [Sistotremastrum suecicum HHB10207 ss-3]|uniref:Nucleolar protein 12 n=1 Tax=Sistotremastrum suecicum HHB10207 ss-3 TaxID=1314776 RepID=A0A166IJK0_9AGAM|nr:RNA-binding domain-containing protein [Sistotremastrum suecicum HHB10207 ss-3]
MDGQGLSSFLLKVDKGKGKAKPSLDSELDSIFQTSSKFAPVPGPSKPSAVVKPSDTPSHKRLASETRDDAPLKKKKRKTSAVEAPQPVMVEAPAAKSSSPEPSNAPKNSADENSETEESLPVHESIINGPDDTPRKKKFVPEDETQEVRDRRTIFIGNVPVAAAKSKSGRNGLTRHITTLVPGCKVESVRFRSVAFKTPSSKLPDDKSAEDQKLQEAGREQQRQRTAQWRAENDPENAAKVFLTKEAKKKVSFIKKDFHPEAEVVNAYVVFAHSDPGRSKNVPPIMDPFEAAEKAVKACDTTVFMGHTIHVDRVGQNTQTTPIVRNTKNVVFVGNLDFEAKEEDLRTYFESLASTELSLAVTELESDSLIKSVRIVRDRDTRLGKGFAYVEFATREAADAVLALDESKVKFAKRKLRLQRCKTLPGTSASKVVKDAQSSSTPRPSKSTPIIETAPLIQGDPTLGEKLKGMSKEERKAVKLANADRVARRLQKKKARNKLEQQGVAVPGKERSRQRSKPTGSQHKDDRKSAPKKRIRSDKLIAKRNTKK